MPETPDNPNLHCLVELANRDGVDIRPTLLRAMTDLYVQKPTHSADEDRHYTELALALFDLVDAPTRIVVAEKIAGYANAPAAVRRRALRDRTAPIEPAGDARPAGPDRLAADPFAADPFAADPFAGRKAGTEELTELFFSASTEERRLILANLPYAPLVPSPPIAAALAREATERLEAAALGHNGESFARELQRALTVSPGLARRLRDDPSGEPIVVAAVALGMPAFVLQRVLLCLSPSISQSVQRVYDLAELHEELVPEAALRLLAIWRASREAQDRRPPPPKTRDEKPRPMVHPRARAMVRPMASQPLQSDHALAPQTAPVGRPKMLWDEYAKSHQESA